VAPNDINLASKKRHRQNPAGDSAKPNSLV